MATSTLIIASEIFVVFAMTLFLGFLAWKRSSRRAGIAIFTVGFFDGLVLIVNYFEAVPSVIVIAGLVALWATGLFAIFEHFRGAETFKPA